MKRELMSVLIGAALILPAEAEAQRGRKHVPNRGPRVTQPAPAVASGRLNRCRAPAHARSFECRPRSRVVYSSRARYGGATTWVDRPGYRYHDVYRPYRDARVRVRLEWGGSRIHFHAPRYRDAHVGPGALRRILGPRTVNQVRRAGRRLGLRGAPRGHWIDSWRDGRVLVVTMEGVEIAEFVDYDRDGFVDDAFFFRHDGGRRWVSRP